MSESAALEPGKLEPRDAQAILDVAKTEANKGSVVHVFDPDASPQEKAAAAGKAKDGLLSKSNGGQELSVDTGHGAPPPTITISDVDKQHSDEAENKPSMEAFAPASPTSAVAPKMPGELSEVPVRPIPDWYVVGWRAATGIDNAPPNEQQATQDLLGAFLKEQYYGDWYHNAGVIFFAVIASHFITLFRLGWGSLIILMAFCATYYTTSIGRVRVRSRDDIQRELVKTRLLSESESADWINNFMERFWKIYEPVLSQTIIASVDQILSIYTPPFLESLSLTTFTLGTKAPRIESVRTFPNTPDDEVLMDWEIAFTPTDLSDILPKLAKNKTNPKIILTIRLGKGFISAPMPILVEDITFKGKMRIHLKLMNNFPHVQLVNLTFLEKPIIDYVLKPIGGEHFGFDIANIPGLSSFIRDMTHGSLGPMMYDPNVFTLNLEQLLSGTPLDAAIGVLQVTVHTASGLKTNKFGGGAPDPYVCFNIENREEMGRTTWKTSTYNPAWHETKFLLINSLSETLYMHVWDYNEHRKDSEVGTVSFELAKLKEDATLEDLSSPVMMGGKDRGTLRYDISFYPVLTPTKVDGVEEPLPETTVGIVRLTLHQAKDLDNSKTIAGGLNPFAKVYLSDQKKSIFSTHKTKNTLSPIWEQATEFLCVDRTSSIITIKVIDDRDFLSDPTIGHIRVKLEDLLAAKKEGGKDWWPLSGCKSGKMKLSAEWKPLAMAGSLQGAGRYKSPIGIIRLWMKRAEDVKNVEASLGGKSDPYVRVMLSNVIMARTEVINNNLNPEWDQIIYVPVHSRREVIVLECMDYQNITKDRSLGSAELKVGSLIAESKGDKLMPYASKGKSEFIEHLRQGKSGNYKGKLFFDAEFIPAMHLKGVSFDAPPNEIEQVVQATKVTTGSASASGSDEQLVAEPAQAVNGAAKEGEEFKPGHSKGAKSTDTMMTTDTSVSPIEKDEGITLTKEELLNRQSGIIVFNIVGGQLAKKARLEILLDDSYWPAVTTPKAHSVHAKFDMVGEGFVKELDFGQIWLKLNENDDSDKENIIAEAKIEAKAFLEKCLDGPADFILLDQNGGNESRIEIQVKYIPVGIVLEPRESAHNQGNLRVELISGQDIHAADRSGKSDPFAVFSLNDQKVFKSQTKKKTLNPEWSESFECTVPSRVGSRFEVEVFDWNQIEQSKSLGVGTIDLESLEPFSAVERTIPLQSTKLGQKGEVKISLVFQPAIIAKQRKNTSTFNMAGRAATEVGALPLSAGKGLVHGVGTVGGAVGGIGGAVGGFAGKTVKGVFGKRGGKEDEGKSSLDVPEASASRVSLELPTTQVSRPADYTTKDAAFPTSGPSPTTVSSGESSPSPTRDIGNLKVTIMAAKDLAGAGGDMVKPFVVVKVGSNEQKTKHLGKTLAPEWENEVLYFPAGPETKNITATVMDHKTIGKDRVLGEAVIDVWSHINPAGPAQDVWTELRDGQGLLRLRLEFSRGRRNSNASVMTNSGESKSRFASLKRITTKPTNS